MSITSFLGSVISFQVRKRIAAFLREPLPDDFIPPPPHAFTACGDVNDVGHGDLNGTPSTLVWAISRALFVLLCRAFPLV